MAASGRAATEAGFGNPRSQPLEPTPQTLVLATA